MAEEPKITEPTTATEHHAEASKGGLAGYLDKAKGAALDYLEKNPPAEEPASGLSGYLDKAKVAAKSYLESPKTEGTGETKAEGAAGGGVLAGLGLPGLIEKALSLFHKNEGREVNAESDTDVKKLSEYIKKYLNFDIAPETIKTQLASLKARFGRGHSATPVVGDTPAPAST